MRKNGVNRELRPIDGGVCAPEGYTANAVSCGLKEDGGLDFMMILSAKRCSVGFVGTTGNNVGAPVKVTKKNMRMGYARAIIANGGIANVLKDDGERLAFKTCDLFFYRGLERTEIVLASTGEIGKSFPLEALEKKVVPLMAGLDASNESSLRVAEAISSNDNEAKQLSFAFDLGDYPCKIGVIFKGGRHTAPNVATFLAFLTTDVNIATPMLQRALEAEVRETLNMLNLDGTPSPNDCVCILANGKAGNYKIDCEDSEYKKFTYALRATLVEVCKATARTGNARIFKCTVGGGISKEVVRGIAKRIVGAQTIKEGIRRGEIDVEGALYLALEEGNSFEIDKIRLGVRSVRGEAILFEDSEALPIASAILEKLLYVEEVELFLDLRSGNFQATGYSNL